MTVVLQAPLSMGFPRQEHWSGLPFPSPFYVYSPCVIYIYMLCISVQFGSVAQSCPNLCDCSTPGLPVHHQLQSLLKLMFVESMMPSNHLSSRLQSFPASGSFQMSQFFVSGGQSYIYVIYVTNVYKSYVYKQVDRYICCLFMSVFVFS